MYKFEGECLQNKPIISKIMPSLTYLANIYTAFYVYCAVKGFSESVIIPLINTVCQDSVR